MDALRPSHFLKWILRKCTMHMSSNTLRTAVTNRADFAVMRIWKQMGKPLVAARGSGGIGHEVR